MSKSRFMFFGKRMKKWSVHGRSLFSILIAGLVGSILPPWLHWATRILCIWNAGTICFLGLTWWAMAKANPAIMRRLAVRQDEGRVVILGLITTSACISLLAIAFMLRDRGTTGSILALHLGLAASTIIGSWLLVHTIFALHYAHGYYQNHQTLPDKQAEGLDFPDDIEPDYWDFLYFSFVIGMTSQVSDVEITSRSMRRLALGHGILSFFFNTTILAMSINIIAGLI
jgi:uncharacterized membrane protein